MSLHIGAQLNEIAETVLICGDPLRAINIAESMFSDLICYNQVRGMPFKAEELATVITNVIEDL